MISFIHPTRTVTIDSEPRLQNTQRTSFQQTALINVAGRTKIIDNKIKRQVLDLVLQHIPNAFYDQVEDFYRNVVFESKEAFEFVGPALSSEVLKAGYTVDGNLVGCGDVIQGTVIECGRPYRFWDEISYENMRFVVGSYSSQDTLNDHTTVKFSLFRDIDR